MTILDEIYARKQVDLAAVMAERPMSAVRTAAETAQPARDFAGSLRRGRRPALIAEVKRASPSKGRLCPDLDPVAQANLYRASGAAAVSILTEEHSFLGSLDDLRRVRKAFDCREDGLPLLRKDFLSHPYQVYEARAAGADAILLIAAMLDTARLKDLYVLAGELGMAALVEVHDWRELDAALELEPTLVGINNRDLRDFSVHLETTLDLRPSVPPEVCLVAESGIHTRADVVRLAEAEVDAILVGEALVTAADPAAEIERLLG